MRTNRSLLIILAGALSMGVAACGSSSSTGASTPSSSSPPASTSAPASTSTSAPASGNSAAEKTIAANWVAFFNAKTPTSKRIALLQDGSAFATIIKSQAGSGLAGSASAKVTKVTVTTPSQAKVTYDILVGGQPALSGKTGVAVKQGGTWKVGVASFCGLLALEAGGKTSGLPSACKAAG
jgi:ABC-type glycerol-3-phosphate transport system substrate-binding protein